MIIGSLALALALIHLIVFFIPPMSTGDAAYKTWQIIGWFLAIAAYCFKG